MKKIFTICLLAFIGIASLNAQITSTFTTSFTGNGTNNYTNAQYLNPSANAGDVYPTITTNAGETNHKWNFVGIPTNGGKYIVRTFTNQAITGGTNTGALGSADPNIAVQRIAPVTNTLSDVRITNNNGYSFRLRSIYLLGNATNNFGTVTIANATYTITLLGYYQGSAINGATMTKSFSINNSTGWQLFDVTSLSEFGRVDELRIQASAATGPISSVFIDEITAGAPVSANTAPTFTNATTTFSVCQNTSQISFSNLLTVSDADAGQTETFSLITAPNHGGAITTGSTVGSGINVTPTGWAYTPDNTYTGTETFTIQVNDGNGGTANKTITVTVNAGTRGSSTQTSCNSYIWHGTTYTSSGNYTYSYNNANGCASTDTLHLTINNGTHNSETKTVCNSYFWNGVTYTQSGDYIFYYDNASDCASADTLHLTINQATTITTQPTNVSACSGNAVSIGLKAVGSSLSYQWFLVPPPPSIPQPIPQPSTLYSGGLTDELQLASVTPSLDGTTYVCAITNSACGTTTYSNSVTLTVNQSTHNSTTETQCGGTYTWHGTTYTTNGDYTYSYNNANGCASIDTLHLTIKPNYSITASAGSNGSISSAGVSTVCEGNDKTYSFSPASGYSISNVVIDGTSYGAISSYTFTNVTGNHSISVSFSSLCSPTTSTSNISICPSELPYSWNNLTFTVAGSQTTHLTNATGCDSAATLNLTVKSNSTSTTNVNICSNQLPYSWNNNNYPAAGTYTIHLSNAAGCDSAATLNLTVSQVSSSTTNVIICNSALPYIWNNNTFTATGSYTVHLTNSVNCDSAATLNLTVNTGSSSTTKVTICNNLLPYIWNNQSYTASGSYTVFLPSTNGCDSAATLNLTVNITASAGSITTNTNGIVNNFSICSIGQVVSVYPAITGGSWSSNTPSIATGVKQAGGTSSGYITAISPGVATIVYTLPTLVNGCYPVTLMTVRVDPQATPSAIVGSSTACVGVSTSYSSTPAGGVWTGVRGTFVGNVFTATSAGSINIAYTVTNASGCSASANKAVTNSKSPAIPTIAFAPGTTGITGSGGYCRNKTFTLVGTPSGGSWGASGAFNITAGGVVTTLNAPGAASVSYTVTSNGCSSSRTQTATVTAACKGINTQQSTVDSRQLTIYPNPTHSIINLKIDKLTGAGSIVVTDLYGKQVKQQALSMGVNTIDVSSFAKGMYLVSVITEQGKQTQKVIVE